MTIKMRLSSILAASVLAASAGLATGLAAAPAGANPGADVPFTDFCLENPCPPDYTGPGDLAPNPPEDDDGGEETTPTGDPDGGGSNVDVPIPANANFTG
jgi:hypothetical protein